MALSLPNPIQHDHRMPDSLTPLCRVQPRTFWRRLSSVMLTLGLVVAGCTSATTDSTATFDGDDTVNTPSSTSEVPSSTSEVPSSTSEVPSSTSEVPSSTSEVPSSTSEVPSSTSEGAECQSMPEGMPWSVGPTATARVVHEGGDGEPRVEAVVYPHPEYEGNPWSQWGQGIVLDDHRYFSAIGDHRGPDGNSYLYEYDPATGVLALIADALSTVDHVAGDWGFGKIHAQMVRGPCGTISVATYWGTRRGIEFTSGYQGDLLLTVNPNRRTVASRGVIHDEHGIPSLAASPDGNLIYAEAVDPTSQDGGAFIVRDAADGTTVFVDDDPSHTGYRSIAIDAAGRAFYSLGDGTLAVYDPITNASVPADSRLPGAWLRASSKPDARGTIYGVTRDPDVIFALDRDGSVRELSDAGGYTTSIGLSPDGSVLYSVPEAHGDSWKIGAPLIATDTGSGEQETVIELQPLAGEHLGLRLGGTYNVVVDEVGSTVYVGMNASRIPDDSGFGEVVLFVVMLP